MSLGTSPFFPPATRRLVGILSGLVIVMAIVGFMQFRGAQPQLGADEEVFITVDALFTALTSRDPDRLDDCERRLNGYRGENRLADTAANVLDAVIRQARGGDWDPAARRLYAFMLAQRRD